MKQLLIAIVIALVFLLTGCARGNTSGNPDDPTVQGHIVDIKGDSILVIENIASEDVLKKTTEDLLNQQKPAYWFDVKETGTISTLQEGYEVKVWIKDGVVAESYPMQGTASDVQIVITE